jgi:hypothetical protein
MLRMMNGAPDGDHDAHAHAGHSGHAAHTHTDDSL